jgi:hypothetical protein
MASITAGLAGGSLATIVTTVVMTMPVDGGPPPTARLGTKFAGGDPDDHAMPGMVLHLLYGVVLGRFLGAGILA